MSKFPLYDRLAKDIPDIDLTLANKRNFVKKIEKIDQSGHELIYALIKMYQLENNDQNTSFTLPYNGKFSDSNIIFDIDNFPISLKHILYKFIDVHIEKMKEDKSIETQTPIKRI